MQKLCSEAAYVNPRLREPLYLYAAESGKLAHLMSVCKDKHLAVKYEKMNQQYDLISLHDALERDSADLDERYRKIWHSYQSARLRPQSDAQTKELIRHKILELRRKKGISNYRIYKDLGLNAGNFNAWLKHGDDSKISLKQARNALNYLRSLNL